MGDKRKRVWEMFVQLTGVDQMEIQKEMNPIIKKLKINLDKIQMDDIRKIVTYYMKSILEKERLKSVAFEEELKRSPSYNHN